MSIISYILVNITSGQDRAVVKEILKLKEILECTLVYGECDLVLKVEVEDFSHLDALIFDTLRKISGVESTKTLIGTQIIK